MERETRDLDFFADRPEAVLDLLPVLEFEDSPTDPLHLVLVMKDIRRTPTG